MTRSELGGPILAAVSRSFYLSIRLLPEKIRAPIGLAYLLARTSDTIADSASAAVALRLAHLDSFEAMIQGTGNRLPLPKLQEDLAPGCNEGERVLLGQIGPCLDWLETLDSFDQAAIRAVLTTIIRGQRLDLQRFADAGPGHLVALRSRAELDEYTWLVAGCVGEFWTRVCLHWLPRFSRLAEDELTRCGRDFGKGLQLVNILRDLPADLRQGRCYLPEEDVPDPGTLRSEPAMARPAFAHWLARAREQTAEGARYVQAVRPARVRMACFLPWSLGVQTLDLLEQHPPLDSEVRVKVPRRRVYRTMITALRAAFSDAPLR